MISIRSGLIIKEKSVNLNELKSITSPINITGLANATGKTAAEFGLPDEVTIKIDIGEMHADIAWNVNECTYAHSTTSSQTFIVSGTVTLPNGVKNTSLSLITSISITVNAASGGMP